MHGMHALSSLKGGRGLKMLGKFFAGGWGSKIVILVGVLLLRGVK